MADTHIIEDWLPSRIYLIDRSPQLVERWQHAFANIPEVEVRSGDYFQQPADALVSPANSFGIMDGGIDLAIRERLGEIVQLKVQDVIVARHHGELPVGSAEIVETGQADWKYLISAPTMRVPENVAFTLNAYLAFRAVLVAVENFNQAHNERVINSLVCCGLATGAGGMTSAKCSAQMRIAYRTMVEPSLIQRFETIQELHSSLLAT